MTIKTVLFCDACLEDIPPAKPGECFDSYVTVTVSGRHTGLNFQGSSEKHFHNAKCLRPFLDTAEEAS